MGTEIFTFGPLEPEKIGFKDSNPTFEIMTKTTLLRSKFFLPYWVIDFSYTILCIILQFGHLKAWQKMNNLEQSTIIYIWKRSKWQQIIWMSICGVQTQKQGLPVKFLSLHLPLQQISILKSLLMVSTFHWLQPRKYRVIHLSIWQKKLGSEEGCFCHNSKSGVAIFKPHFLRLKWSKCKNFSAH